MGTPRGHYARDLLDRRATGPDDDGYSPRDLAVRQGHADIVALLDAPR
jgi:ankyrin repeat protein